MTPRQNLVKMKFLRCEWQLKGQQCREVLWMRPSSQRGVGDEYGRKGRGLAVGPWQPDALNPVASRKKLAAACCPGKSCWEHLLVQLTFHLKPACFNLQSSFLVSIKK